MNLTRPQNGLSSHSSILLHKYDMTRINQEKLKAFPYHISLYYIDCSGENLSITQLKKIAKKKNSNNFFLKMLSPAK